MNKVQYYGSRLGMGHKAAPLGYIFGCNRDTIDECLQRCLFGLPVNYREDVEAIAAGTPLFLFHYNTRVSWGNGTRSHGNLRRLK